MRKHLCSSTRFQSFKFLISFFRIGENKLLKEQQKVESKREGEEMQQLTELHQWEQRMERERQVKQKSELMQAHVVGSKQGNESGGEVQFNCPGCVYRNTWLIETM